MNNLRNLTWNKALPYYALFAGVVGAIASLALSVDKLKLLEDPNYDPACDINPILSCGSVMESAQASAFGIPHSFFGLIIFGALIAFGVLLIAGGKFASWLWHIASVVAFFGFLGVLYLAYQSFFELNTLCPWCMVVWVVSVPVFMGIISYDIRNNINLKKLKPLQARFLTFVEKENVLIMFILLMVYLLLVLTRFWDYWSSVL
jgi:uncharacterized membrane protein